MFHYNEPFPNPGMKTGVAKRRLMFQSAMWLNKKTVNYTSYSLDYHKADKHQLDKRKGGDTNLCCCCFFCIVLGGFCLENGIISQQLDIPFVKTDFLCLSRTKRRAAPVQRWSQQITHVEARLKVLVRAAVYKKRGFSESFQQGISIPIKSTKPIKFQLLAKF